METQVTPFSRFDALDTQDSSFQKNDSALARLGYSSHFARAFERYAVMGLSAGRVAVEHRGAYVLFGEEGEVRAELAGRVRHDAASRADLPAVGDWVAFRAGAP